MSFVHLHCHSDASLLDGASKVEELVAQAATFAMPALALTDHNALYGVPRFIRAAKANGLQPILGAELTLEDEAGIEHHLTVLVENEKGWHNLCYLVSRAQANRPKGAAALPHDELVGCTEGLVALSGCRKGKIAAALLHNDPQTALTSAQRYRDLFGPHNFYIELQQHHLSRDAYLISRLSALANHLKLACVATNNVHYATRSQHRLHDVKVCIRHTTSLDEAVRSGLLRNNSEYYLKSPQEMARLFSQHPQALVTTLQIAERCCFTPTYGLQDIPRFQTPHGMSAGAYLRRLCEESFQQRYPDPSERARNQLKHELQVIERAKLENYFLILWDIVRYARACGIRCQGRGSAANSLVAFLLFISPIDPLRYDLVFERFLSDERQEPPDVDIDFDSNRRDEIFAYVYETYGIDHEALTCAFNTYHTPSALQDVSKVLALRPEVVAAAFEATETGQESSSFTGADNTSFKLLLELCKQLEGHIRHLSIHPGGMVLFEKPLVARLSTEPTAKPDLSVVHFDKDGLEDVGIVKFDILGLKTLSSITEAVDLIAQTTGDMVDLDRLAFDDPNVYEMISQADTIGVFQVESRAQAAVLPRLRPQCFEDVIISISLIRPGPVQAGMVHPFLRRREGLEPVTYAHPLLEPILAETLGVIIFQEQVLKVAQALAGFTPGQGELLRRALGAKNAAAAVEQFHEAFLRGAQVQGVAPSIAEEVFRQLKSFGSYSFAQSHAGSFAVLVYQSAWLKRYYPTQFFTAILNNQPMGFWNPSVIIHEIKQHDVHVMLPDMNRSQACCTVEDSHIRLGLRYVKGLGEAHIKQIIARRDTGIFENLYDFCTRTRLNRTLVENLIQAGAMDSWGERRDLVFALGTMDYREGTFNLVFPHDEVNLPELSTAESMLLEQQMLGLSPGEHIMSLYRSWLDEHHILNSRQLAQVAHKAHVQAAGLLVVHQSPPTAKGVHFLTLQDEWGMINVVVWPDDYSRYRTVIKTARLLLVSGTVQQQGEVTNLMANRIAGLDTAYLSPW